MAHKKPFYHICIAFQTSHKSSFCNSVRKVIFIIDTYCFITLCSIFTGKYF